MSHGQGVSIIVLLILLICLAAYALMPTRWEYMLLDIEDQEFQARISEAGSQEWELIFARRAAKDPTLTNQQMLYEVILKRPASLWHL